jgi:hypothetical protein
MRAPHIARGEFSIVTLVMRIVAFRTDLEDFLENLLRQERKL